jgi:hypothetical protein
MICSVVCSLRVAQLDHPAEQPPNSRLRCHDGPGADYQPLAEVQRSGTISDFGFSWPPESCGHWLTKSVTFDVLFVGHPAKGRDAISRQPKTISLYQDTITEPNPRHV